jgi:hypothetical protein
MEILMFNRRLGIGLSLACVLAACAGSNVGREASSAAAAQNEKSCGGQYGCIGIKPLNTSQAAGGARSDAAPTIVLQVNGTQITIERSDATTTADGCTWTGIVQETGESAMLMWWKDGRLTGMLSYKGHIYTVMNAGDEIHAVREVGPRTTPSEAGRTDVGDKRVAARSEEKVKKWPPLLAPSSPEVEPFSDAERQALEAKKITIDLMVLYTKKAASHYIRNPADVIALAVEQTNQSFRNSGLENISLRLVHTQLIDYDETGGEHFGHLYRMVDGVGPLKAIHKLRDEKRAGADAEAAYFIAHHSCAAITYSIAHEIGHILGARHDRQADASNMPFPFGHGYVNGNKWRDVMSYQESCDGCPRIPHWSNPRIKYKGEPTGTVANDNARVILGQAERVSKFR